MMKHFRICTTSPLERVFAVIGAMVSVGALGYLVCKKCNLCKDGCHCHGEFGAASGTPDVTMDFSMAPKTDDSNA